MSQSLTRKRIRTFILVFRGKKSTEFLNAPAEVIRDFKGIPGLLYCSGFVDIQSQQGILQEIDAFPWSNDLQRRVQHYGYKYDYKTRKIDSTMFVGALPAFAIELGSRLLSEGLIDQMPDQLIVNEYLPGQGIASHVDCEPCFQGTIATVSIGAVYEMDFTCIQGSGHHTVELELGSVLILSGDARYRWKHGIKARKSDHGRKRGRRVSLTFRNVILDASLTANAHR